MGSDISSFDYTYDNNTNNISTTTTRSSVSVNSILDYDYDDIDRLTQATNPIPAEPDESFSYDTVGNRLAKQGQVIQSVYDDANRLLENEQFVYQYDNNGNIIQKTDKATSEITQYSYDAENQLIEVSKTGMTASYRYDDIGRRIEKDVNGIITRYIYDETDIIMEYDGSNTMQVHYTFGLFADEPLISNRNGQNYYYLADKLGSIMEITDDTGQVVKSYVYDSFGNIVLQSGTLENPFTYTGREFDAESGLYYYRMRHYDPGLGRFISEDPLEFQAGINFYSYVKNNPVNFKDPFGLNGALNPEPWSPPGFYSEPYYPSSPGCLAGVCGPDLYYYTSDFCGERRCLGPCFAEAWSVYNTNAPIPLFTDPSSIRTIASWSLGLIALFKCAAKCCSCTVD